MIRIEYIGKKPRKEDNVAGTTTVWTGPGDVRDLPDDAAHKLIVHSGVWRIVAPVSLAAATPTPPAGGLAPGCTVAVADDPLAGMSDKAVKAWVKQQGLAIPGINPLTGDKLRAKVHAALEQ